MDEKEELERLKAWHKKRQNYVNNYQKERYKRIVCLLPIDKEELFNKARGSLSASTYIQNLIEQDMNQKGLLD